MGNKQFLTPVQKRELAQFVAASGENYEKYLEWARIRNVTPFTKGYFHQWINRRRGKIQQFRDEVRQELRKLSMFDRERRLTELEQMVETIDGHILHASNGFSPHPCTECGWLHEALEPEVLLKFLEQKRRTMEQIAKERGEWLKSAEQPSPDGSVRERLRAFVLSELQSGPKVMVVEGTAEERQVGEDQGDIRE